MTTTASRGTTAFVVDSATNEPVRVHRLTCGFLISTRCGNWTRRSLCSRRTSARGRRSRVWCCGAFIARCMVVRHVLGPLVGVSPEALAFETPQRQTAARSARARGCGRPCCGVGFQLVPFGSVLALAVALDRQVSVDIEVVQPGVDVLAVAETDLRPGARLAPRVAAEQQRPAFYGLWTRKEAMSKVGGQGIASPPVAGPSLGTLHSFQFRLGETDVIGALALDFKV